jgi:hypothetical protein
MILEEYFNYRKELLDQSKDEEGFINQNMVLSEVLPSMMDAKLIDTEDYNSSYFYSFPEKMKVNAYCVNDSGERLQLFVIDESSIDLSAKKSDLQVSQKIHYDNQFKRCIRFLEKSIKGHLNDEIQDSHPARALISQISSSDGAEQFDVFEIFLISITSTVSLMGAKPQPKRIDFDNEEMTISYTKNRVRVSKDILVKKRLIDLNFLYNVLISQGNREALRVDFEKINGKSIEAIKAADEEHFESYLCVLPAEVLAGLYREYSTRLLEKNVRSFLQFRGVNAGMKDTIRKAPEKFIAYNNGLTITSTNGEITNESGRIFIKSLTDFQIVNGGQTTAAIYFSKKEGLDISGVSVMAKINVAKEATDEELDDLITNISTFSNAQSRVSKVDLRSRNPQLVKLKSLTDSVLTPSGLKWFFERAKGEFNTKVRISGSNKNRIKKEYPNERRFSKEQLAKYYTAWGDQPYVVKKGGEKVFRIFIEEISGEGKSKKPTNIDRTFYEELIAKIILFRKLEKLYGQGKNSMGQIRSAVVPYSISILHHFTDAVKGGQPFNLLRIWVNEGLEDDLLEFISELLSLTNELIKKYSLSDDLGEYSKKPELWDAILKSNEVRSYMNSENARQLLIKYSVSKEELKKRNKEREKTPETNFKNVFDNIVIFTNGDEYYRKISSLMESELSISDKSKLSKLITSISQKSDIDENHIEFERHLINRIRLNNPELFDQLPSSNDFSLNDTLNYIVEKYNSFIEKGKNVESEFKKIELIASSKKIKYASIYNQIGTQLSEGISPSIKQINYASYFLKQNDTSANKDINISESDILITDLVMRKMVEWDSVSKILSENQRHYVAEFAYGLKEFNSFHEKNIKGYLERLIKGGFKLK